MQFDLNINKEDLTKSILTDVYNALQGKGYNPINQLVGYLISGILLTLQVITEQELY